MYEAMYSHDKFGKILLNLIKLGLIMLFMLKLAKFG
jgi:hypothetical protein